MPGLTGQSIKGRGQAWRYKPNPGDRLRALSVLSNTTPSAHDGVVHAIDITEKGIIIEGRQLTRFHNNNVMPLYVESRQEKEDLLMGKKQLLLTIIGMAFVVALAMVISSQAIVSAQECRIIRVHGGGPGWSDRIEVEPGTTFIDRGTCVIWSNWVRTDEIKIIFEDGKKCDDMTDAAVGFSMDAANCYVTSWVPLGGTSSLKFNEAGTFEYGIEAKGGLKARGKIVVQ